MEDKVEVHWNSSGVVYVLCEGQQLMMTRYEAEDLFVDLGHALQDMDRSAELHKVEDEED